ncbi:MAG TPA: hypothetical protein VFT82_00845 [Candidatus Paceibacterota bacterium]|nr:hypothetical protein [Candidatus Paceibacterota bacterium]
MVTITKLIPPENQTLFERFPELNRIWDLPRLQDEARSSYERWNETDKTGEIFSIDRADRTIGIIGWFEFDRPPEDVLRLRYYGIVPSERGGRHGSVALWLLLKHLATVAPKRYRWLSESVSLERPAAPRIIRHFEEFGFRRFDDPEYGQNAECGPTMSLRVRILGR